MADRFHFGEFEFDRASGDLRRRNEATAERLPPQPARLLALLAERRGGIVTRDEIRHQLWSETHVDFDASLHFCVRQLRVALGDSGAEPRYVQNVPRRGYRLIPDVTVVTETGEPAVPVPSRRWMIAALAVVVPAAVAGLVYGIAGSSDGSPAVRIAIMPFEPPIAEWVLEDLSQAAGQSAGIIGPATTSAYAGSDDGLRRLAADYRVDYIVNGRHVDRNGNTHLLVEVIRVSDGVHVWVRPYDDLADGRRIGEQISRNVTRVLQLP
jgi:DNA-binding winged helix-turn-helix (wHTH) protein/TolB-like protein